MLSDTSNVSEFVELSETRPLFPNRRSILLFLVGLSYATFRSPLLAGLILVGVAGWRLWARVISVQATESGLRFRNYIRSYQFAWDEIEVVFPVNEPARLGVMLKTKTGQFIKVKGLTQSFGKSETATSVGTAQMTTMVIVKKVNEWVKAARQDRPINLQAYGQYLAECRTLVAEHQTLMQRFEELFDEVELDGDEEFLPTSQMQDISDEADKIERELFGARGFDVSNLPTYGYRPLTGGSLFATTAGWLAFAGAAVTLVVAVIFGPLGNPVQGTVVAHPLKSEDNRATIVEYPVSGEIWRGEMMRTEDAPPYAPKGSTLTVVYWKSFPGVVADQQDFESGSFIRISEVLWLLGLALLWFAKFLRTNSVRRIRE